MVRFNVHTDFSEVHGWLGVLPEKIRLALGAAMADIVERLTSGLKAGAPVRRTPSRRMPLAQTVDGVISVSEKTVTGSARINILAQIIESGVNADVSVRMHARRSGKSVISIIKAYQRHVEIPARPFMLPLYQREEAWAAKHLENAVGEAADAA